MAEKFFAINTEAHVATVGPHRFLFVPEVIGAEFAGAYAKLKEAQATVSQAGDDAGVDEARAVHDALRHFLRELMLPESVEAFDNAKLPDRVLVAMLEWIGEVYGGGSGNEPAPGGRSSGS